jgi:hypothetical protein
LTAVVDESVYFDAPRSEREQPDRRPLAVAIDNHPGRSGAPRVVAKGRGALAEHPAFAGRKIRLIALTLHSKERVLHQRPVG